MYLIEFKVTKCTHLDTTQRQVVMGYIMECMNIHRILVDKENFRAQIKKVIIPNASLPIPINEKMGMWLNHLSHGRNPWFLWMVINNNHREN